MQQIILPARKHLFSAETREKQGLPLLLPKKNGNQ